MVLYEALKDFFPLPSPPRGREWAFRARLHGDGRVEFFLSSLEQGIPETTLHLVWPGEAPSPGAGEGVRLEVGAQSYRLFPDQTDGAIPREIFERGKTRLTAFLAGTWKGKEVAYTWTSVPDHLVALDPPPLLPLPLLAVARALSRMGSPLNFLGRVLLLLRETHSRAPSLTKRGNTGLLRFEGGVFVYRSDSPKPPDESLLPVPWLEALLLGDTPWPPDLPLGGARVRVRVVKRDSETLVPELVSLEDLRFEDLSLPVRQEVRVTALVEADPILLDLWLGLPLGTTLQLLGGHHEALREAVLHRIAGG